MAATTRGMHPLIADLGYLQRPDVNGQEAAAATVSGLISPLSPDNARWETLWHYMQGGPGAFAGDLYYYMVDGDLRNGLLAGLDTDVCPLYLLTGDYDYSATVERTMEVVRQVKGAKFTLMPGLGHFPMSENPELFLTLFAPRSQTDCNGVRRFCQTTKMSMRATGRTSIMTKKPTIITANTSRRTILRGAAITAAGTGLSLPLFNIARADNSTIKIGVINSITGVRAQFAEADNWTYDIIRNKYKNGIKIGGKTYSIDILPRDDQSSLNGAAPVANDLLLQQNVDMLLMPDSDAAIGAGDLCDSVGTPGLSTMTPLAGGVLCPQGQPANRLSVHLPFLLGVDTLLTNYLGMWKSVPTNNIAATLYFNNSVGQAFSDPQRGLPAALAGGGFSRTSMAGPSTRRPRISRTRFRSSRTRMCRSRPASCSARNGSCSGARQHRPAISRKSAPCAGPFLFPSGIDVLGSPRRWHVHRSVVVTPGFPFTSSLTGQSGKQLADNYETVTGRQWTQPIGYVHAQWEVAIAALQKAGDPHDKKGVAQALRTLSIDDHRRAVGGFCARPDAEHRHHAAGRRAMAQFNPAASTRTI